MKLILLLQYFISGLFKGNTVFTFSNIAALINYSATHAVVFLLSLYLQYVRGSNHRKQD